MALLANVGESLRIVDVQLAPEEIEIRQCADQADISLRSGVEIEIDKQLNIGTETILERFEVSAHVADQRLVDIEFGFIGRAETRMPLFGSPLSVKKQVRLGRTDTAVARIKPRLLHIVQRIDLRRIKRWM